MDRVLHRGSPEDAGMAPERVARLSRLCARWVEEGRMPALQVLVARRGVIVLEGAWGRFGPGADAPPLTVDGLFGTGSLTKPITAAAIMCLMEDGLLSLNRPVQEYVPTFTGEGKAEILVHHLLTHTSGLDDAAIDAYALDRIRDGRIPPPPPLTNARDDQFIHLRCFDALHDAPLSLAPATEMVYCNFGYRLLAEIVGRVAGQPPEQFVQQRIFDPLGMNSSSYLHVPADRLARVVRRSPDSPWPVMDRPDAVAAFALGAGALHTTVHDMARFTQMFLNGGTCDGTRILSPASVAEMTRNQIPGISALRNGNVFPEASWSYGWGVRGPKKARGTDSLLSAAAFEHGGIDMNGLWGDPTYDLVGCYLSVLPPGASDVPYADWCGDLFVNAAVAAIVD